jgi:hypothetical protein
LKGLITSNDRVNDNMWTSFCTAWRTQGEKAAVRITDSVLLSREGRCEGGNRREVTSVCVAQQTMTQGMLNCPFAHYAGGVEVKRHSFLRLALQVSDQLYAPVDLPQRTALATHLGQGRENRGALEKKGTWYLYWESNLRHS